MTAARSTNTAGALRMDDTITQITECTFTGNTCVQLGGALWTRTSNQLTVDSCTFIGNSADEGGAINVNVDSSSFTIRNSVFRNNSAVTLV